MNMGNEGQAPDERVMLKRSIALASSNLMLFAILTVVNMVLIVANANIIFSFSAELPPILFVNAIIALNADGLAAVGVFLLIIAVISVGFIFLCSVMSKRKVGWLIAALVYTVVDLLLAAAIYIPQLEYDTGLFSTVLFSVLFHAWMLYYVIKGISAYSKLKRLPAEPMTYEVPFTHAEPSDSGAQDDGQTVGEQEPMHNETDEKEGEL